MLNAAGQQQYQAIREPAGYFGGLQPGQSPPLVSLSPGQEATAILEVGDVYPNGNFCPSAPALLVTMPGDTTSRKVPTPRPRAGGVIHSEDRLDSATSVGRPDAHHPDWIRLAVKAGV